MNAFTYDESSVIVSMFPGDTTRLCHQNASGLCRTLSVASVY